MTHPHPAEHSPTPADTRRHRRALREAVLRMLAWNPERVIIAHGRWYERDGAAELVAVTLGHEGAILAEPGGTLRLPALDVPALGAGGTVAAFLLTQLGVVVLGCMRGARLAALMALAR